MKVLVTGAAGFIGSHLCERLVQEGHDVVGLDNFDDYYDRSTKEYNLESLLNEPNFVFYEADIRDRDKMFSIFKSNKPARVAHLAAKAGVRYSLGRALLYTDININGTINMLDASCESEVEGFVFASTSSIYGETKQIPFSEKLKCGKPLAPYPATKGACEFLGYSYYNTSNLNFTALRFFSVYGPRGRPDMMPHIIIRSIDEEKEITLFDGGVLERDWTYIDDIVSGIYSAIKINRGYEIINLGRGSPHSMKKFVKKIEVLMGKKAIIKKVKAPVTEPKATYADISKAKKILGYNPVIEIDEGLDNMVKWYKNLEGNNH